MSQTTLQRHISRLMALLLCALLLLPCIPAARAEGGSCGGSLIWSLDGNTLTISGSGDMTDYNERNLPPWFDFRAKIYQLVLPEGLTSVGSMAFYDCTNLTMVSLPSTVTDIEELAFCQNSGMKMLSLNNGLRSIGRSAFDRCESLTDLRIPGTVQKIGDNAFYLCTSLQYVTVPASVTKMGTGVFTYCDSLIRVDIEADIPDLPFWTFYGCDNLNSASFHGEALDTDHLKNQGTQGDNSVTLPPSSGNTAGSLDLIESDNGTIQVDQTIITKTENTTITKTETTTANENSDEKEVSTDITASVINPDGWTEIVDQIQSAQDEEENSDIDVNVYVPAGSTVPQNVLTNLAGSKVNLTVSTNSGAHFKVDCTQLDAENIQSDLDLSYMLTLLDTVPEGIDSARAYQLTFNNSCNIKAEVMIRLPQENIRRAASLYQFGKEETYDFVQSVVVDNDGYAHYYLAAIDKDVHYLIAMDVKGEQSAQAIVPDNLKDEYRLVDHSTGKEYVITGRKSSWNMGLGKVMAILAVVMVSAIGVIGFVMYFWNKQRLKNGYVPQWEDDEQT